VAAHAEERRRSLSRQPDDQPGASYTLEHVHNGSGNLNLTVGDSIFHCHFYPHFAQGMWSLWRTHDVFEPGTKLDRTDVRSANGIARFRRRDRRGSPTPAIVPLPQIAMAPMPARTRIVPVKIDAPRGKTPITVGYMTEVNPQDIKMNPGYPFFVPGMPASARRIRPSTSHPTTPQSPASRNTSTAAFRAPSPCSTPIRTNSTRAGTSPRSTTR